MRNRYIDQVNSDYGWQRKEALKLMDDYHRRTYLDAAGVLRWSATDRVPPNDILEFWQYVGHEFDAMKTKRAGQKEREEFIERYRERQAGQEVSEEHRAELRAAFGPGVEVVDVFTGRKIIT